MELPLTLYNWLVDRSVLTEYELKEKTEEKVVLDQDATQLFEIGLKMPLILLRLQTLKNSSNPESHTGKLELDGLKDSITLAAKLYNWNLIVKTLEVCGIHVEDDIKSLIISGDLQILTELLWKIMEEESKPKVSSSSSKRRSAKTKQRPAAELGMIYEVIIDNGIVDLDDLNVNKKPEEIRNCLEFLLITISKGFKLKPKQAAGLMTDGNKYLSHILVKGLKNEETPVTTWLSEVYELSDTFANLIKLEEKNNSVHMVLNCFKGGLYSKHREITIWTARIFTRLANNFLQLGILGQAWEWYIAVNAGLDGTIYFLKKHFGMGHIAFDLMSNIARQHLKSLFTEHYKSLIDDPLQYWNNNLSFIKPLYSFITKCNEEEKNELEEVVKYWIDSIYNLSNNAEFPANEKSLIPNILVNIWLLFPHIFENNEKIPEYTLSLLTRCARDKNLCLSLFSLSNLFKLLEVFAQRKSPYAPLIYKALTFSIVENYATIEIREFAMENFMNLFQSQSSIPVGILIDPLIKQIQLSETSAFSYELVDFRFFTVIANNQRLNIKNGIQLLDALARILLNEPLFVALASQLFIKLVNKWPIDESIEKLLEKFVKIALSTLMGSMKKSYKAQRYQSYKQVKQSQDDLTDNMQNHCIIDTLKQVQIVASESIKNLISNNALIAYSNIKQQFNAEWTQLKVLIIGNSDKQIAIYEKKSERRDDRRISPQRSKKSLINEKKKPDSHQMRGRSLNRGLLSIPEKSSDELKGTNEGNRQLVPYVPKKNDMEISKKAMQEIEKIRRNKLEKEAQKQLVEAEKNDKKEREKKSLKQQLEWRKVELGVGKNTNIPIVLEEGTMDRKMKKILPEIQLIDFSYEEEREREAVFLFMKKYRKLFRYLFTKYANSCYSTKIGAFDALKEKAEIINLGELTKLIKDHNVSSSMLNREELATFVRLVNSYLGKTEINNLTFEGFQECFLQIAIFIYSRPPLILSHLPLVESVRELVNHFERVTEAKGDNTVLYKNPDITTLGDKELLKELNRVVKTNPDYPVPEGYRKINEKEASFEFIIKQSLGNYVSEAQRVVIEILEETIFKEVFGIHIIQPIVKYEVKTKVYPDIVRPQKQLLQPRYMEAVEKKLKPRDLDIKNNEAVVRKRTLDDSTKKLPANMKLIVANFPKETREIAKEVAGILNEIIETLMDNNNIPAKKKINKALLNRVEVDEEVKKADVEKEQKRKNRHYFLKQKIDEARKKEAEEIEKKKKEDEENKLKEKEKEEKEKLERQKEREKTKKKLQEMKGKKEEEKKKVQEEELKKQKVEDEKRAKARDEFLKKKKEEIEKKLKETEEKRKKEKEEEVKQQMLKEKKLKEKSKFDKQTKEERETRETLQKQKIEFEKFMRSEEVIAQLNSRYYSQLEEIFNFYSKLDDLEINHEVLRQANVIQYKSFVKFTQQFSIIPQFVGLQDILSIFNNVVKNKRTYGKENIKGLTKEDFLEALVKICILGKYNLGVPIEEVPVSKEKEGSEIKGFDLKGVDVMVTEKFLKMLGLTAGEKKGPVIQMLKKIKQENAKECMLDKIKSLQGEDNNESPEHKDLSNEELKYKEAERKEPESKVIEHKGSKDKVQKDEELKEVKDKEMDASPKDEGLEHKEPEGKEDVEDKNEVLEAEAIGNIMEAAINNEDDIQGK